MQIVKFLKPADVYGTGELAGFDDDQAARLIARGLAEAYDPAADATKVDGDASAASADATKVDGDAPAAPADATKVDGDAPVRGKRGGK